MLRQWLGVEQSTMTVFTERFMRHHISRHMQFIGTNIREYAEQYETRNLNFRLISLANKHAAIHSLLQAKKSKSYTKTFIFYILLRYLVHEILNVTQLAMVCETLSVTCLNAPECITKITKPQYWPWSTGPYGNPTALIIRIKYISNFSKQRNNITRKRADLHESQKARNTHVLI